VKPNYPTVILNWGSSISSKPLIAVDVRYVGYL